VVGQRGAIRSMAYLVVIVRTCFAAIGLTPEQQANASMFLLASEEKGTDAIADYDRLNPCSYWQAMWARSRSYLRGIHFVHVPKAGGHYVESWLMHAFHGGHIAHTPGGERRRQAHVQCVLEQHHDTTDCWIFHGGHHPYTHRIAPRVDPTQPPGELGMWFVTAVREPVSRLISQYDDATGFLSSVACSAAVPSYCSAAYEHWCLPGTGTNFVANWRRVTHGLPNSTRPCRPRQTFFEYAMNSQPNEQSHHVLPLSRKSWNENRTRSLHALRALLRTSYLMVGATSSASALAAYVMRLRHALDTPWQPSTDKEVLVGPTQAATGEVLALRANASHLTPAMTSQLRERHWLDAIVYDVAMEIDAEQQRCFEALPWRQRAPPTQNTTQGLAVVSSSWWLPASQVDAIKPGPMV